MFNNLLNQYKIWKCKKAMFNIECQIIWFEIPYEIAEPRLFQLEQKLKQLNDRTVSR